MGNLDLYAQALRRRHARTRLEGRAPAGTVERLTPGGELVAAEPSEPAGGTSGAGSRSPGELLAQARRVFGDVELTEEPGAGSVNTVNRGKA